MKTQLEVVKADGSSEEYLHTKVIGAINKALVETGHADIGVAEEFAEVVTYFLYHKQKRRTVTSSEILSIIKVVLAGTNYEEAAAVLSEHHFQRRLKRSRIEVVEELTDNELYGQNEQSACRRRWDKSQIISGLVEKQNLSRQTARMIASMVEEKVFGMCVTLVSAGLIKQLVLADTAAILRAERQLETV